MFFLFLLSFLSFLFSNILSNKLITAKCERHKYVVISLRASTINDGLYSHSTIETKNFFSCYTNVLSTNCSFLPEAACYILELSTLKAFETSY